LFPFPSPFLGNKGSCHFFPHNGNYAIPSAIDGRQGPVAAVSIIVVVVVAPLSLLPGPPMMILSSSFSPPPLPLPLLLLLLVVVRLLEAQEPMPFEAALVILGHRVLVDIAEIADRNGIPNGRCPRAVCSLEIECTIVSAIAALTIMIITVVVAIITPNIAIVLEVLLHKRD
jgi:hypothetical protein